VPDQKCLTDNIDRFDALVLSGSLGPSPYAALVNMMIDMAIDRPGCLELIMQV
jgi:hypothetical protein